MSFRMRMVLASLIVGVFAILAASFGAYFASRNALTNSADDVLVSAAVRAVAAGNAHSFYTNVRVDGIEQREYVTFVTLRVSNGVFSQVESGALQVAISLTGVNEQLGHLGLALLLVALAALTLAVVLGWLVSRTAVGPLDDLTATVEELAPGIHRVMLRYGFMESPNIPRALEDLSPESGFDSMQASYFLGREVLVPGMAPNLSWWRRWLFLWLARNAVPATEFFRIPSDRVVELGVRIAI